MIKSTKIVCTIGPKSRSESTIREMALAGMNVARMNLSHGDREFHTRTFETVRKVSRETGLHLGVLLDLQGPKIRTGKLAREPVVLEKGKRILLTARDVEGDEHTLGVNYDSLERDVKQGDRIFLDDASIELRVAASDDRGVDCVVVNGGAIRSHRGVNLPDTELSVPSITRKDEDDLSFGLDLGVDFVALSFVRKPEDLLELREQVARHGAGENASKPWIIAKIEKREAVARIEGIIEVSDAVMIARGDLGAETSPEEVPVLQKRIIELCNRAGKPVITATQMLESMVRNPRPTRAEASDVANAIFDGTDAVMLSGETAIGDYPVGSVRTMTAIAAITEGHMKKRSCGKAGGPGPTGRDQPEAHPDDSTDRISDKALIADTVCRAACGVSGLVDPRIIAGFTLSGRTASLMSRYRPPVPIVAMSPDESVLRRLSVSWGVKGLYIGRIETAERLILEAEKLLLANRICVEGDRIIIVGGVPVLGGEPTNMLKVHRVSLEGLNF